MNIYIEAIFLGHSYWRITFPDGGMSRANTLSEVVWLWMEQGGRIWIDKNLRK